MARGGARPGAGRKSTKAPAAARVPVTEDGVKTDARWPFGHLPNPEASTTAPATSSDESPLEFLLGVMRDTGADLGKRMQAAALAAPFVHPKMGEASKKGAKADAAKQAGSGKFGASPPPLRSVR